MQRDLKLHWTLCFPPQDALSLLAEKAELSDEEGRGVAFRRAAAVLKVLPKRVTSMTQLRGLPCLGDHSLRVIKASGTCAIFVQLSPKTLLRLEEDLICEYSPFFKDILENGTSSEVEETKQSERFRALKVSGRY